MSSDQSQDHCPVSPIQNTPWRLQRDRTDEKRATQVVIKDVRPRTSSSSSSGLTIQTPRTARFAEATSVDSPIDPSNQAKLPFKHPQTNTRHLMAQPQPADVGFGYVADNRASHNSYAGVEIPLTPNSPLRSALKVPGTPGRLNPLSPTFKEEQVLEKHEEDTEKMNAKDLVRLSAEEIRVHASTNNQCRKSRLEFAWLRCVFEAPTSAAALLSLLCYLQHSLSSTQQKAYHPGLVFPLGLLTRRPGPRLPCLLSHAFPCSSPSWSSMATGEGVTGGRKRLLSTILLSLLLSSPSVSLCGQLELRF